MAEQTPQATPAEQKPKPKVNVKTLAIIMGVLILEAGTIVVVRAISGGPKPSEATEAISPTQRSPREAMAEVPLCQEMAVDNWVSGRARTVVTLRVVAKTPVAHSEELTKLVEAHATQIKDRIRQLVGSAQPDQIRDPQLQVIKREIGIILEDIIPPDMVAEVLIPTWQSFTVD